MNLWKDPKRIDAQKLIDWLLSTKKDDGWSMEWNNMVAFAELGSSSSHTGLTQSLIMQVLGEMNTAGKKTVDDFEEVYGRRVKANKIAANRQVGRWQFFIPIEVFLSRESIAQRSRIRILGKNFSFLPLSSVERRLDPKSRKILGNPTQLRLHAGAKAGHIPNVFLSVSAQAPSWDLAWKEVEPAFDALRGMIELSLDFYRWQMSTSGKNARRSIPHPLWMVVLRKGMPPVWPRFITDEESSTKPFDLDDGRLAAIKENAAILGREPKPQSTLSLIADCLRLYSQAMDSSFRHLSFLGFWQLAEAVTNSETVGGKTDDVVARLAWHGTEIGLKASGYRETLRALGKKRNSIVHRGISDVEDDDINILKLACEAALEWLFQVQKALPTKAHIERYYRLREENKVDLAAIRDCVAFINKRKGK